MKGWPDCQITCFTIMPVAPMAGTTMFEATINSHPYMICWCGGDLGEGVVMDNDAPIYMCLSCNRFVDQRRMAG
jgi:hypothetical protein